MKDEKTSEGLVVGVCIVGVGLLMVLGLLGVM